MPDNTRNNTVLEDMEKKLQAVSDTARKLAAAKHRRDYWATVVKMLETKETNSSAAEEKEQPEK